MKLIKPSKKYATSFWRGLKAMRRENKKAFSEYGKFSTAAEYVRLANDHEAGKNLPQGWIPYYTYWAIVGDDVVGEIRIRPRLTKFLRNVGGQIGYEIFPASRKHGYGKQQLALALKKVKKLKLNKIILTCDATNNPSRKIIESNGGILKSKTRMGKGLPDKLVYGIKIK